MFEKNAEDRTEEKYACNEKPIMPLEAIGYKKGFKDGAEFGYNKAKVEVEDSYRESLCNSELNLASVTEQLEELEKANKWHKVANGDLPDEGTYLVVWQNNKGYKEIFIMNYEEDDEEELHWVDGDYENQDEYIIAWCEIPTFDKE